MMPGKYVPVVHKSTISDMISQDEGDKVVILPGVCGACLVQKEIPYSGNPAPGMNKGKIFAQSARVQ